MQYSGKRRKPASAQNIYIRRPFLRLLITILSLSYGIQGYALYDASKARRNSPAAMFYGPRRCQRPHRPFLNDKALHWLSRNSFRQPWGDAKYLGKYVSFGEVSTLGTSAPQHYVQY